MIDALLVAAIVWMAARERRAYDDDLGSVPPRPYPERHRYWHRGRECHESRDPQHTDRVRAARRTWDEVRVWD